jgi:hypothetical protein
MELNCERLFKLLKSEYLLNKSVHQFDLMNAFIFKLK